MGERSVTIGQDAFGNPRAVEFLDALIDDAILSWEYDNGPFEPGCLSVQDEQGAAGARREAL